MAPEIATEQLNISGVPASYFDALDEVVLEHWAIDRDPTRPVSGFLALGTNTWGCIQENFMRGVYHGLKQ